MEKQVYVIPLKDIFLNCKSLRDIFSILNDIGSDNLELSEPCDGVNLVLRRLSDSEIEMLIEEGEFDSGSEIGSGSEESESERESGSEESGSEPESERESGSEESGSESKKDN